MGTTSRHLPCFVPEDTAKWQVLFYHYVDTYAKKKHEVAKNLLLAVRTVMDQQQVDIVAWHHQSGSDPRPINIIEPHGEPHRCGDKKACQVNGRMCVGS